MNILERILFFFYNLVIAGLSVIFIVINLKLVPINSIGNYFQALYANDLKTILINLAIGLVFFFFALRFIYINFQGKREPKRNTIDHLTEIGDVKIAIDALEAMAVRTGQKIAGVRNLEAKVVESNGYAKVALKATLDPDINIPEVSEALQAEVKGYLENLTGIKIERVIVLVKDVLDKPAGQKNQLK